MKTPEEIAKERNDEKIKAAKKYAKQYEGLMYTIGSIAGVSGIQMAFERGVAFGLHQALEITVERESAERAAEQHWISVKDRLPEEGVWVLGYYLIYENNIYDVGVVKRFVHTWAEANIWLTNHKNGPLTYEEVDSITYWQPLPAPPKEEK